MSVDVASLFNAIFSTFAIISLGYALPSSGYLPKEVGKSISPLVGKFLLPCLLFEQTATLQFDAIDWQLVGAIVLGKVIMFVLTVVVWWLFDQSSERKRAAALAGMFIGNQNDLAMGLAIIPVLFPGFESYLYVTAVINLVFLVPCGIVMIEMSTSSDSRSPSNSCPKILVRVLLNPLVVSGFCGIMYKFLVCPHVEGCLPGFVKMPLMTAKAAFPCCALFLVGHGLLATGQNSESEVSFLPSMFLTAVKLVLTPICIQVCIKSLIGSNETYLQFGYLYGTLPTAPSTIVIASSLGLSVQSLCSSILLSTAVWAPLCFLGAIVFNANLNAQLEAAIQVECIVSDILSIVSLAWLLGSLLPRRTWRSFYMLIPLLMAQLVFSMGDLACRLDCDGLPEIIFIILNSARLGLVCFGCLLVAECLGLPGRWLLVVSVASCVAIPLLIILPHSKEITPDEPQYRGRCWWRSHQNEQAELYFYAGILLICVFLIPYLAVRRRRRNQLPTESDSSLTTVTPSSSVANDGQIDEAGEEELLSRHMSPFARSMTPWLQTVLDHEDLVSNASESAWLLQFLSLNGMVALLFLFLLAFVNELNKGQAGFSVILLLQCVFANGMGLFFSLILLDSSAQPNVLRSLRRRWVAFCPALFDSGVVISDDN